MAPTSIGISAASVGENISDTYPSWRTIPAEPWADRGRGRVYLFWDNWNWPNQMLTTIVRTSVPPLSLTEAARRELRAMDPTIPMAKIRTLGDYLREERAATSFATLLVGVFAGLAALLAAVGLYGVICLRYARPSWIPHGRCVATREDPMVSTDTGWER